MHESTLVENDGHFLLTQLKVLLFVNNSKYRGNPIIQLED